MMRLLTKWMISCEEASRLSSAALDRRLTLTESAALRYHTLLCAVCKLYQKQITALHALFSRRASADQQAPLGPALPAQARERIRAALNEIL